MTLNEMKSIQAMRADIKIEPVIFEKLDLQCNIDSESTDVDFNIIQSIVDYNVACEDIAYLQTMRVNEEGVIASTVKVIKKVIKGILTFILKLLKMIGNVILKPFGIKFDTRTFHNDKDGGSSGSTPTPTTTGSKVLGISVEKNQEGNDEYVLNGEVFAIKPGITTDSGVNLALREMMEAFKDGDIGGEATTGIVLLEDVLTELKDTTTLKDLKEVINSGSSLAGVDKAITLLTAVKAHAIDDVVIKKYRGIKGVNFMKTLKTLKSDDSVLTHSKLFDKLYSNSYRSLTLKTYTLENVGTSTTAHYDFLNSLYEDVYILGVLTSICVKRMVKNDNDFLDEFKYISGPNTTDNVSSGTPTDPLFRTDLDISKFKYSDKTDWKNYVVSKHVDNMVFETRKISKKITVLKDFIPTITEDVCGIKSRIKSTEISVDKLKRSALSKGWVTMIDGQLKHLTMLEECIKEIQTLHTVVDSNTDKSNEHIETLMPIFKDMLTLLMNKMKVFTDTCGEYSGMLRITKDSVKGPIMLSYHHLMVKEVYKASLLRAAGLLKLKDLKENTMIDDVRFKEKLMAINSEFKGVYTTYIAAYQ